MRRLIICSAFILVGLQLKAQFKIGLQISPAISSNRFETNSDFISIQNDGSSLKFRFGPIADFAITETYYFHTGILYAPKEISLKSTNPNDPASILTEKYNLQYLQIPLAIKLYTNEIQLDTKLYFILGMLAEVNISEKAKEKSNIVINNFSMFDTSLLLAAGVEYSAGVNTVFYGGLSYNRGLLNAISTHISLNDAEKIIMKNDLINLDLGVKF